MPKPAFDPSQPFDRVRDVAAATPALSRAKPAFDPNQPFDAAPTAAGPTGGRGVEAFARNLTDSALLGFSGEIKGGVEALKGALTGDEREFGDIYTQERDAMDEARAAASAANPGAALAGDVAGWVIPGTGLVKGAKLAGKGASLGTRVAQGAGMGAAVGAVQGLGQSQADLTEGEFGEAAFDTGVGAATGAAVGGFVPAAGTAVRKMAGGLDNVANNLTGRHLGFNKPLTRRIGGDDEVDEVSRVFREEGLLRPFRRVRKTLEDVRARKEEVGGGELGAGRARIDAQHAQGEGVDIRDVLADLDQIDLGQPGTTSHKQLTRFLERLKRDAMAYVQSAPNMPTTGAATGPNYLIPASKAMELKNEFWRTLKQSGLAATERGSPQRRVVTDAGFKVMGRENELFERLEPELIGAKRTYGGLADAERALEDRTFGSRGNNIIGLPDYLWSSGGATAALASGAGPKAALVAAFAPLISKGLRVKGPQVGAFAADRMEALMRTRFAPALEKAAAGGPAAAMVAVNALYENEPEFRGIVDGTAVPEMEDEPVAAPAVPQRGKPARPADPEPFDERREQIRSAERIRMAEIAAETERERIRGGSGSKPGGKRARKIEYDKDGRIASIETSDRKRKQNILRDAEGRFIGIEEEDL